jgi:hypothetical protein
MVSSAPKRRPRPSLAPKWSHEAADWLVQQDPFWRIIGGILGLIMFVFGGALLFGGGYTSIQGVRVPLSYLLGWANIIVPINDFPPLGWWSIPLLTNVIQIFSKWVPGLRALWYPSVIFDGITTAVFIGMGFLITSLMFDPPSYLIALIISAGFAAALGLAVTVVAEKFFLASVVVLRAVVFLR